MRVEEMISFIGSEVSFHTGPVRKSSLNRPRPKRSLIMKYFHSGRNELPQKYRSSDLSVLCKLNLMHLQWFIHLGKKEIAGYSPKYCSQHCGFSTPRPHRLRHVTQQGIGKDLEAQPFQRMFYQDALPCQRSIALTKLIGFYPCLVKH